VKRSTQRNWRNLQLVEGGLLYCRSIVEVEIYDQSVNKRKTVFVCYV